MRSAALRFIDMLFSSSGFPSKSVIVLEVVLLSTSPALCRDFICTDTAHIAYPFGFALAALTRIGLIGRNDPLSTLDCGAIPKADPPLNTLERLGPYLLYEPQTGAIQHPVSTCLCPRAHSTTPP